MMIFSSTCNTEWHRLSDGNCLSAFAIIRHKTMLVLKFHSFCVWVGQGLQMVIVLPEIH